MDPSGRFAYVANGSGVAMYTIDHTTGALTSMGTIAGGAGLFSLSVAVDPSGRFVYVARPADTVGVAVGYVSMYAIDATSGALTSTGTIAAGIDPFSVAVDPSGSFAYVANLESGDLSMYSINGTTGVLTSIGTTTTAFAPHTPATVNLGPTINLVFFDMRPASSRTVELPLIPGTRRDQPYAEVKFLPSGTGKLTYEPFAVPDSTARANAAPGNLGPTRPVQIERSLTPSAAGRFEVAHVSPVESERLQRLPTLYQEDTPFSTQVRLAVANLWGGRLQFDAFYREISANSLVRGLPQPSDLWRATPGSLTLCSATSYGIRLSFRMPHIRTRTLYRCLLGRSG